MLPKKWYVLTWRVLLVRQLRLVLDISKLEDQLLFEFVELFF